MSAQQMQNVLSSLSEQERDLLLNLLNGPQAPENPYENVVDNFNVSETLEFIEKEYGVDVFNNYESVDENNKAFLIIGEVQSGKTNTFMSHNLMSIVQGVKTLVIVRNLTVDVTQLIKNCNNMAQKHSQYVGHKCPKLQAGGIECLDDWFDVQGVTTQLVLLANKTQLGKFMKKWNERSERLGANFLKYNLTVDEADQSLQTEGETIQQHLSDIVGNSNKLFAVTATPNGVMNLETCPNVHNIIRVKIPEGRNYHGFHYLTHMKIEKSNGTIPCEDAVENKKRMVINNNNPIHKIIKDLDVEDYNEKYDHPVIFLPKIDRKVQNHEYIAEYLHANTSKNWASIIFNGKGVTIEHVNLNEDDMVIERVRGKKVKMVEGREISPNAFYFVGCDIAQGLSLLKGIEEKLGLTHVCIVAGALADRGTNFCDSTYTWHITHQYIEPSTSSTMASMVQSLRICGIHRDNMPLKLYCSKKNHDDLKKEYQLQKDILEDMEKEGVNIPMSEFMDKKRVHKSRKPSKKSSRNDTRMGVTNRMSMDNLEISERLPTPIQINVNNNYGPTTNNIFPGQGAPTIVNGATDEARESTQDPFKGIQKIREIWNAAKLGKVYNILNYFHENCGIDGEITPGVLELELSIPKKQMSDYTKWDVPKGRYNIIEKHNGNYRLRECVKEILK